MKSKDLLYDWCFGCDNYQKSLNGPICKISNKTPDFINSCNEYIENKENLKKSQQEIIKRNYKNDDYFEYIKPTILTKTLIDLPDELIIRNKKFNYSLVYFLLFDFFGAYLFHYLSNDTFNIINSDFLKIFGFLSIVSIPIYSIIISRSMDQSDKIALSENGIKIENGMLINWRNAYTYIISKYASSHRDSSHARNEYLVVKSPFKKEKTILIDSLNKSLPEISNLIENYKKNT